MPKRSDSLAERASGLLSHELRVFLVALFGGLPAVAVALVILFAGPYSAKIQWTLAFLICAVWLIAASAVHRWAVFPLRTLSNFLRAIAEGDYTLRLGASRGNDALAEVVEEANALGDALRERRLDAIEASALLKQVMAEIDVVILAFDPDERLSMLNPQAERVLGMSPESALGRSARELHVEDLLHGHVPRILETSFGGGGRWELRRATFRERGLQNQLIVLSDLTRALHEEERRAWRRLIQVLQHEINNSLAPISSLADTLGRLVLQGPHLDDCQDDLIQGLSVISQRSKSLNRFMASYAQLTRLPEPQFEPVRVSEWISRAVSLEARVSVAVSSGPDVNIRADNGQVDQLLINLVRNAADAASQPGGEVHIGWKIDGPFVEVCVQDNGPGLPDSMNLFVPFFTTKATGTGVGLVISRQIAEAHGGTLALKNRNDQSGCRAIVRLPRC